MDNGIKTGSGRNSPCQLDSLSPVCPSLMEIGNTTASTTNSNTSSVTSVCSRIKREFENDSMPDISEQSLKKHCPDDEEINAQVQSAIASILNLQRSDPATDEAVRSILPS